MAVTALALSLLLFMQFFSASNTLLYPPVAQTTSCLPNSSSPSTAHSFSWEAATQLQKNVFSTLALAIGGLQTFFFNRHYFLEQL